MGAEVAVIAAMGALATGMSAYSNARANSTNAALSREALALNKEQFDEQMRFNKLEAISNRNFNRNQAELARDFNRQERLETQQFALDALREQREYNSPAAQAERMRQAGLNPSVIDGDGSFSPIQSSPAMATPASSSPASAPSWSGASIPEMKSVLDGQQLVSNINGVVEAMNKREDVIGKRIDNETRSAKNAAEINGLIAKNYDLMNSGHLKGAEFKRVLQETKNLEIQRSILDSSAKMSALRAATTEKLIDKELRALDDKHDIDLQQRKAMEFTNKIAPDMNELEKRQLQAAINDTLQSINLKIKNGEFIDKQKIGQELANSGVLIQNAGLRLELNSKKLRHDKDKALIKLRGDRGAYLLDTVMDFFGTGLGQALRFIK